MDKIKLKNYEFELANGHRTLDDFIEFDLVKSDESTLNEVHDIFTNKDETMSIAIIYDDVEHRIVDGYTRLVVFSLIPKSCDNLVDIITVRLQMNYDDRYTAKIDDLDLKIAEIKEEIAGGVTGVDKELINASAVVSRAFAQELNDGQALQAKALYEQWEKLVEQKFTAEKAEYKFLYGEDLYKTIKAGQEFQGQWIPGEGTESIYTRIDETHAGTIDDPIPYSGNMELENGKYYSQDGVTYLCNRDTGQAVYQVLKDLVGIYVEVVE